MHPWVFKVSVPGSELCLQQGDEPGDEDSVGEDLGLRDAVVSDAEGRREDERHRHRAAQQRQVVLQPRDNTREPGGRAVPFASGLPALRW